MRSLARRVNVINPRPILWFVALWCFGLSGALLLALPFEVLMRLAMR